MSEYMALVTRKVTTLQHQIVKFKSGSSQYSTTDAAGRVTEAGWEDTKQAVSPISVDHVKEIG